MLESDKRNVLSYGARTNEIKVK